MSSSDPGRREVAYRLFAAEYDDATRSYSESDEERAPNYVISPTGGRVNRLFLVGVLTAVERVNEEMLRARIADPSGAFVAYAGQYQPDSLAFLEAAEPPMFLAVTGKARTFQPEDSDRVFTSVRPESINEVEAETRDRWVVRTAEATLDRVATAAAAKRTGLTGEALREALESDGVEPGRAHGTALALEHYGTTGAYLQAVRRVALDATRVVAGEREEVRPLSLAPGEGGDDELEALADGVRDSSAPAEAPTPEPDSDGTSGREADTEPGDFELDEETRQRVEEEHGVEFETGADVGEPGETPIDSGGTEADGDGGAAAGQSGEADVERSSGDPESVDLESALVETMGELSTDGGADRDELVATMIEEYGVSEEEVEAAIQDALMSGRCYEPDEGKLRPI